MATNTLRGKLLRTLPVLLIALLALFVAPRAVSASPGVAISPGVAVSSAAACSHAPSVSSPAAPAEADPQPSTLDEQPLPADVAAVLDSQFTAGVRGSRAPPAASV